MHRTFPLSRPIDDHKSAVIKEFGVEDLDRHHAVLGLERNTAMYNGNAHDPRRSEGG